jgi:hypothetical protein
VYDSLLVEDENFKKKIMTEYRAQVIILKKHIRDLELQLNNTTLKQINPTPVVDIEISNKLLQKYFSHEIKASFEYSLNFVANVLDHVRSCLLDLKKNGASTDLNILISRLDFVKIDVDGKFKGLHIVEIKLFSSVIDKLSLLLQTPLLSNKDDDKINSKNVLLNCRQTYLRKKFLVLLLQLQYTLVLLLNTINLPQSESLSEFITFLSESVFHSDSLQISNCFCNVEKTFRMVHYLSYRYYRSELESLIVPMITVVGKPAGVSRMCQTDPEELLVANNDSKARQRTLADVRIHQMSQTIQELNATILAKSNNKIQA